MLRPLALLLSILPACAAPKAALQPLALRDPFAVVYRGSASAAEYPATATDEAPGQATAAAASLPTVDVRAAMIELDATDARALLASLPSDATPPWTEPAGQGQRLQTATGAAMTLAGIRGAHLDAALVDATIEQLKEREDVSMLMAPRLAVSLGEVATIAVQEQRAVVRSLDFLATDNVVLANPHVDRIDYGDTLRIRATEGKPGKQLAVTWSTARLVSPVSMATTPFGSIQTPALVRHELSADAPIQRKDAIVLASIPGSETGRVCLLFLVVEVGEWPRAGD